MKWKYKEKMVLKESLWEINDNLLSSYTSQDKEKCYHDSTAYSIKHFTIKIK